MNEISKSEQQNPAILKLKKINLDRLDLLRRQNDGDLDEKRTAEQRGRIKECKRLLKALGHEFAQTPKVTDTD